jgi:GTP-binding protein
VREKVKKRWIGMLFDYLKFSTRCCRVFLLINAEHGVKEKDLAFLHKIKDFNIKVQIVLTKADKIKPNQLYDRILSICITLQ